MKNIKELKKWLEKKLEDNQDVLEMDKKFAEGYYESISDVLIKIEKFEGIKSTNLV